ncbi:MAG: hypothetical protein LBL06_02590 [Treponema sp.]|nr:hypothetical protein [Treponema sp.]
MAKRTDWFPGPRESRITMAKDWLAALVAGATAWDIPAKAVQDLTAKIAAAETLLEQDLSTEKTAITTAKTKAAFDDLEAFMRDFKRRYFLVPPLTNVDLVSLGLKPQDKTPTPESEPTAQPEADLAFPGVHLVELKNIRPANGPQHGDGSDCGVRVHYGLTGEPTTQYKFRVQDVPISGNDLPYSEWASRKKVLFNFDGESGNTVYFCLQYENTRGKTGPFGPILKAVIP